MPQQDHVSPGLSVKELRRASHAALTRILSVVRVGNIDLRGHQRIGSDLSRAGHFERVFEDRSQHVAAINVFDRQER